MILTTAIRSHIFWGLLVSSVMINFFAEGEIKEWDDLWKPELKDSIMLIDGAREVIGLGLNSLGYSLNSKDDKQLAAAFNKLRKMTPNIKAIVADEIQNVYGKRKSLCRCDFLGRSSRYDV